MVQLTKAPSFKRASNMFKRMGLGSMGSARDDDDLSSSDSSRSATEDSMTFISGLTDDIPDMRDDSVKLSIPRPKFKPPLPPKAPEPLKLKTKKSQEQPPTPAKEARTPLPKEPRPSPPKETRTPPPSVVTAKTKSSKPKTATVSKKASSSKKPPLPPTSEAPSEVSKEEIKAAPSMPSISPSAAIPAENAAFITIKLDSVPQLLFEEVLSPNAKIVEDAIDRLARRCRKSDEIRDETYRAGGHAIVVMAMRRWRDNETIQAGGCRAVTNMSCQFLDAKRSFALIGGVETALVAMKAYPSSLQVQGYGCGALMNILCGWPQGEDSHVALTISDRFVNQLDGIGIVVKAMTSFPKDTKIQLGGCGLFQSLAQNKSFIYSMMQEGAVAAVGASLTSHPNDPNIKKAAGSFMKKVFA